MDGGAAVIFSFESDEEVSRALTRVSITSFANGKSIFILSTELLRTIFPAG